MLYLPYTAEVPPSSAASIACSSVVAGPLSTTSVDSVPVSATTSSTHKGAPAATTAPAAAIPVKNTAYSRLRPTRSPNAPAARLATAVPAISAVSTTPTSRWLYPRAASNAPSSTAVNPYPAARTPCPAISRRASVLSPERPDLTTSPSPRQLPSVTLHRHNYATVVAIMQPRSPFGYTRAEVMW